MYGGHITDAWDRRTCNSYLSVLVNEKLFSGLELGPGFASPNPTELDYKDYLAYVEDRLPPGQTLISCHQYPEFFVYLSFTLLPIYLFIYLPNQWPVSVSVCLCVSVSVCLSVCTFLPSISVYYSLNTFPPCLPFEIYFFIYLTKFTFVSYYKVVFTVPSTTFPFLSYSQPSFHFSTPICYTEIHYSHLSHFPFYFSFHLSYPNPLILFLSFYFSYSISLILSLLYHLSHSILFFLSLSFYSLYSIPPSLSHSMSLRLSLDVWPASQCGDRLPY